MNDPSRRNFLKQIGCLGTAALTGAMLGQTETMANAKAGREIGFGLVTYQWGRDWDLPTLLKNLQAAKVSAVELRTTHAHGVEPSLDARKRAEVKKRFADSPVKLVGLGTAENLHWPDPKALQKAIETVKAFIVLGRDVGGSGVKVRPNDLPKQVQREKTIEQIGKTLNLLGAFGADYGQQIRLEVHGGAAHLPTIKQIMDVADHPNVAVCWNSNRTDLDPPGLERNFNLVKNRLGATAHVRDLSIKDYPFRELIELFVKADWQGWILLEASGKDPADRVQALAQQRELFERMLAEARRKS